MCRICGLKRVAHAGMACKPCSKASGELNDPHGKSKANNDRNNPVNSMAVQKRAAAENEARLAKMNKSEKALTDAEAAAVAEEISTTATHEMQGCTFEENMSVHIGLKISFYLGYTRRSIQNEYLRFLTERGAGLGWRQRNRPVLLWKDGSNITMGQAEKELGFEYVEMYSSSLMINARKVEKAMQERFQYLPLGTRLWRAPDKGPKWGDLEEDGESKFVHKVFVTFSCTVDVSIRNGTLVVNQ